MSKTTSTAVKSRKKFYPRALVAYLAISWCDVTASQSPNALSLFKNFLESIFTNLDQIFGKFY